ncbi:hypothetical protein [Williamwhitmania taraxaci]|uniref:Uncharacterized protein n=1 Tax=Williamwhitmania taraxaci TaxID=1640674 RepID=A0A1G6MDM7_9BACT|nr:hypothetical protein [Williamwhitmania taraxaci]SDC53387.1 hypothetical protein SAMN05216323_103542 [Williamwhitmania taraxaci]
MTCYTLTSDKWEGDITLVFHDNGFLATAELPEVFDLKAAEFFAIHFPMHESVLKFYREHSRAKITLLQADTSFDGFWDTYGKKAGSKELARLYWDGDKKTINRRPITLTDREAIMGMVARYSRRYQGEKKEYQPLATSFLHGRMWEAELESNPRKQEVDLSVLWNKRETKI